MNSERLRSVLGALQRMDDGGGPVEDIDLAQAELGAEGALLLGQKLQKNVTLQRLTAVSCGLGERSTDGDVACTLIVESLVGHQSLHTVKLGSNNIGDAGAVCVPALIRTPSALTSLNLGSNGITAEGARPIIDALCQSAPGTHHREPQSLRTLSLARNPIGDDGALALASVLPRNQTLTTLDLWGCGIGPRGASGLATAFDDREHHNATLTTLNLWANDVGPDGAAKLARMLKTVPARGGALKTLRIGGYRPKHTPVPRNLAGKPPGFTVALGAQRQEGKTDAQLDAEVAAKAAAAAQWSSEDEEEDEAELAAEADAAAAFNW